MTTIPHERLVAEMTASAERASVGDLLTDVESAVQLAIDEAGNAAVERWQAQQLGAAMRGATAQGAPVLNAARERARRRELEAAAHLDRAHARVVVAVRELARRLCDRESAGARSARPRPME